MSDEFTQVRKEFYDFCGRTNLMEALEMWSNERLAMAELFGRNEALVIYMRRFEAIVKSMVQLLDVLEGGGMFLPPKALPLIVSLRSLIEQNAIARVEALKL